MMRTEREREKRKQTRHGQEERASGRGAARQELRPSREWRSGSCQLSSGARVTILVREPHALLVHGASSILLGVLVQNALDTALQYAVGYNFICPFL